MSFCYLFKPPTVYFDIKCTGKHMYEADKLACYVLLQLVFLSSLRTFVIFIEFLSVMQHYK